MGGVFRRFWNWLTRPRDAQPVAYWDPQDTPIVAEQLAVRLQTHRLARELGEKCLPGPNQTTLSGAEANIVLEIKKALAGYKAWAAQRLATLNQDINSCDVAAVINRALQIGDEFGRDASALVAQWHAELERVTARFAAIDAEYHSFRELHRLRREPHYPSRGLWTLMIAALGIVVIGEGALNAFFFARGLWGGIVAGFLVAMIFSAINIVLASMVGHFFMRYINHSSRGTRIAAAVGLALYIAVLIVIALAIGHYRDALGISSDDAGAITMKALHDHLFELDDFQSLVLALVTFVFGIFALLDSYHLDDVYPGYGTLHRRWLGASEEHEQMKAGLLGALEEQRRRAQANLDKLADDANASLRRFDSAIQQKETTRRALDDAHRQARAGLEALLGIFRDENSKARPADCRITQYAPIPPLEPLDVDFHTDTDRSRYEQQKGQIDALTAEVEKIRAKVQSAFYEQIDGGLPLGRIPGADR